MLTDRGIDAEHVRLIENAGIITCYSLITNNDLDLTERTGLSKDTIDNIHKEAKEMWIAGMLTQQQRVYSRQNMLNNTEDAEEEIIPIPEKKEVPTSMLTARGIGAEDVKLIEDAGILTCDCLITKTKQGLTDIGYPKAMVDKIWKAAKKMVEDYSLADIFIQNCVRELGSLANPGTNPAYADFSRCLEKHFSLPELQQHMDKHGFTKKVTAQYYKHFYTKYVKESKAYVVIAVEASRRRREERPPENIAPTGTKKEVPITMVTSRGIGAEDVQRIEDAGIHTCDFLITNTNTKQVLTDIGFPKAMVEKIWTAAMNMVNYNSKADIFVQNSVRKLSAIAAKSDNDITLAACADFSSCLEKRFSLCELQQYMYKHRFEAQVTKKYYDQFCSKDKIRAKAYGYFAEEAYQRRREERLQDLKIKSTIAIVDPKEVPIKMVTVRGIGAEDVKCIEDAGILTCDFLITNTKLILTDIGFPEAMVDKIWKAANKMLTENSRADSFIQNSVREFNAITANSNNKITLAACDDLSSCLEKRFSLSELQQYMRKHCFEAHITKKYYDLFCSKDKIGAKAYGHYAEEASRRRSEQRLLDCQIITRVEPEDANNFPQNDELPLRMLIARGIDKEHLKLIDNAGICSCDSLITYTKQDLTAITELSEATIDNILKEAKDMLMVAEASRPRREDRLQDLQINTQDASGPSHTAEAASGPSHTAEDATSHISEDESGTSHISEDASGPSHTAEEESGPSHISEDANGPSHTAEDARGPSHTAEDARGPSHTAEDARGPSHISEDESGTSPLAEDASGTSPVAEDGGSALPIPSHSELAESVKTMKTEIEKMKKSVPDLLSQVIKNQNEMLKTLKELRTKPELKLLETAVKNAIDKTVAQVADEVLRIIGTNMLSERDFTELEGSILSKIEDYEAKDNIS